MSKNRKNNRPLRILLWSPQGSGPLYSGAGMNAYRLYSQARPDEIEIDLAHGNALQTEVSLFQRQTLIAAAKKSPSLSQIRFLLQAKRWVAANWQDYDICHGLGGYNVTVLPAFWMESRGTPSIIKIANHQRDLAVKGTLKRFLRIARRRREMVKRISGIIATSDSIRNELLEYGVPDDKVFCIPNGVDVEEFHPAPYWEKPEVKRALGLADRITILFTGEVTHRKGPHLLLEAFNILCTKGYDCQLVLVGPERPAGFGKELRDRAKSFGLAKRFFWRSFQPEIATFYKAADLFCLPSQNEGMPNALLEAMASGLPSVVTPISGSVDLVRDGLEGFHTISNPAIIASHIERLLESVDLRQKQGKAARCRVEQHYALKAIYKMHLDMFQRLVSEA